MTRVVSIFPPDLSTDRIRRADPFISPEQAIKVIARSGSERWVAAADASARKAALRVGMRVAKAQALLQGLMSVDADPAADAAALERIALYALGIYSPIVSSRISNAFYGWRVFGFGDRVVRETNSCLQPPHKI